MSNRSKFLVDCNSDWLGSLEKYCFPVCYSGYPPLDARHEESTWKTKGSPSIHAHPLNFSRRHMEAMQAARDCRLLMYVSDQLEWTVTFPIRLWHFCKIRINTAI